MFSLVPNHGVPPESGQSRVPLFFFRSGILLNVLGWFGSVRRRSWIKVSWRTGCLWCLNVWVAFSPHIKTAVPNSSVSIAAKRRNSLTPESHFRFVAKEDVRFIGRLSCRYLCVGMSVSRLSKGKIHWIFEDFGINCFVGFLLERALIDHCQERCIHKTRLTVKRRFDNCLEVNTNFVNIEIICGKGGGLIYHTWKLLVSRALDTPWAIGGGSSLICKTPTGNNDMSETPFQIRVKVRDWFKQQKKGAIFFLLTNATTLNFNFSFFVCFSYSSGHSSTWQKC